MFAVLLLVPSTASAATSLSLLRAADGVRLEVKVTSKKPFKKATRPTGVKVTAGGATYKLKKVREHAQVEHVALGAQRRAGGARRPEGEAQDLHQGQGQDDPAEGARAAGAAPRSARTGRAPDRPHA